MDNRQASMYECIFETFRIKFIIEIKKVKQIIILSNTK